MKYILSFTCSMFILFSSFSQEEAIQQENLKKHIYFLASDSLMGRKTGSIHADRAAEYILKEFSEIHLETVFQYLYETPQYKNVIGILEGSDPVLKNEYIIIGAHYDHLGFQLKKKCQTDSHSLPLSEKYDIYHGADDNASGVAALIEIARKLYSQKEELKRSVVFVAFDSEEIGLLGSDFFVKNGLGNINKQTLKMMINLDMVGYLKKSEMLYIKGVGMIKEYESYFHKLRLDGGSSILFEKENHSFIYSSDYEPFMKKGIPALFYTTGTESPYHKPEDIADSIDYEGLSQITDFVSASSIRFINKDSIQYAQFSKKTGYKKTYFGCNMGLGTNQHYYPGESVTMTGKSASAFSAGFVFRQQLSRIFALKGELEYQILNAKRIEGIVQYHTLSFPLSFVLKSYLEDNEIEINAGLGGFYDYTFSSKLKEPKTKNYLYKHNAGLQFSIELRIYNILFGLQAKYGALDMMNKKETESRSISSIFKIGYIF